MKVHFKFIQIVTLTTWIGCSASDATPPDVPTTLIDAFDVPLDGLSTDDLARFADGDALFGLPFRPVDGLGPLFIRSACAACHAEGGRGPGLVQKMVAVEADGQTPATDQSTLPYGHTIRPGLAAGATHPLVAPAGIAIRTTVRLGPPVLGRGYVEAIADSEIERIAAAQAVRGDGIHGVVNRVVFSSVPNPDPTFGQHQTGETMIGRFGLKARISTLDEFSADAFQGDMGLTTPMRPGELPNPDGLTDDDRPGVDLTIGHVDRVTFYLRHLAIPRRVGLTEHGRALFEATQCAACHVPSLHTRADYPITQLADVDAPIYSDLLLHDLGAALADGLTETSASGRMWKTAPLVGLRFFTTYLHDGRARDLRAAVLAHDGEARGAVELFRALPPDDQDALLAFVAAL